MLNTFAKYLLVATSLSPVLGTVAVRNFERGEPLEEWIWWLLSASILIFFCWILLRFGSKVAQESLVSIRSVDRRDHETLTFLFVFLLPFIRSQHIPLTCEPLTSAYVLIIIVVAFAHAESFHFNPVMGLLFGYHFFSIRNDDGVPILLISKSNICKEGNEVKTVRLSWNVYLHIGEPNA